MCQSQFSGGADTAKRGNVTCYSGSRNRSRGRGRSRRTGGDAAGGEDPLSAGALVREVGNGRLQAVPDPRAVVGHPPRTARTVLQVYVSKLRKFLDEHGDLAGRLVTKPHGYVFELEPERLDLRRLTRCPTGNRPRAPCRASARARRPRRNCAGCARGVRAVARPGPGRPARAARLRRAGARPRRVAAGRPGAGLRLGGHQAAIAELYELADEHPCGRRSTRS